MPSLKNLPAVRRLNARTRAAAMRRRRLRKALSAVLAAVAVLIALPPSSKDAPRPGSPHAAHLEGRHVLSLPADPALTAALSPSSTVDVWDRHGKSLATRVPVMQVPESSGVSASPTDRTHVLAGLRSSEMRQVIEADASGTGSGRNIVVTISG